MFVYVIRHAWAGHAGDPNYPNDGARPLTAEGRKRFGRQMKRLVKSGFTVERIACSPLVRCVETAEIVAEHVSPPPPIEQRSALEPGSQLAPLVAWSNAAAADTAWVGHNPDVARLTSALIGQRCGLHFTKGAVAAIEFDAAVRPGEGLLRWFVNARTLGCF